MPPHNVVSKLHRAQRQLLRLNRKYNSTVEELNSLRQAAANSSSSTSTTMTPDERGAQLLAIAKDAGVLYDCINDTHQLSVTAGVYTQDLISHCLVSTKKIPLVIGIVMHMIFGESGKSFFDYVIKSSNTYRAAAERASELVRVRTTAAFNNDHCVPSSVRSAHLVSTVICYHLPLAHTNVMPHGTASAGCLSCATLN